MPKMFVEYLLERKKRTSDILLIVLGIAILVAYIVLWVLGFLHFLKFGSIVLFVALVLFVYFYLSSRKVEYEYCVARGEFDVDSIVAKRYRKHLLRSHCGTWQAYGPYSSLNPELQYDKKVVVCDSVKNKNLWYAVFPSSEDNTQTVLLLFNGVPIILSSLAPYLPCLPDSKGGL